MQVMPDSFRSVILGFSSLAPSHKRAIYVTFGSVSLGIPSALSRIFTKVKLMATKLLSASYKAPSETKQLISGIKLALGGCAEFQSLL